MSRENDKESGGLTMLGKEPYFYIDLDARHSVPYLTENGIAESAKKESDGVYHLTAADATVEIVRKEYPAFGAYRQHTVVRNTGSRPMCLDTVSSAFVCGIGEGGERHWDEDRFTVHYAFSAWQGEAQWRHEDIRRVGLYKTYNHGSQTSVRLQSYGSWSTQKYHPLVLLEDKELHKTWFFEHEGGFGWEIDISARGYRDASTLCVFLSGAHEKNDGWFRTLAPGETFVSSTAIVGCVDGGFEEAIGMLTSLKRAEMLRVLPNGVPPLCFNDYMNCLWALPTREKLVPLIHAAAQVGCEYFVIDAGWFFADDNWGPYIGDWRPEDGDARFGAGGLQGILDEIAANGMLPGVWLEVEAAASGSRFAKEHPECLLNRRGNPIGGERYLVDFRTQTVRDHILSVIDRLYRMGVRYIKNDYNQSVGVGADGARESLADNLRDHHEAVMAFFDSLAAKYPDLLIESCCSGAMRSDFGSVRHFACQSVSDQEDCVRLPSVLSGMSACLPPDRIGIWAYPYPVAIDHRMDFVADPAFTAQFADGRVTAYNMVSGLMGLCYLSGHIECADAQNMKLMREAAALYKKHRALLTAALPVYPCGTFDMAEGGIHSFGLYHRDAKRLMLAVWSADGEREACMDLSRYAASLSVVDVYPTLPGYIAAVAGNNVRVRFPQGQCAMWLLLETH